MTGAELQETNTKAGRQQTRKEASPGKQSSKENRKYFQWEAESWKRQEVGKMQRHQTRNYEQTRKKCKQIRAERELQG